MQSTATREREPRPLFAVVAAPAKPAAAKVAPKTSVAGAELPLKTAAGLELLGSGVRTKVGGAVKVYAIGLYFDAASLVKSLGKGKNGDALLSAAVAADVAKELRLVFVRSVAGIAVGSALADAVAPKVPKGLPALAAFQALFEKEKLAKGSVVSLAIAKGKLTVSIGGSEKACIASAPLCTALLSVYLGQDAVVPSAKAQVLAELTARTK